MSDPLDGAGSLANEHLRTLARRLAVPLAYPFDGVEQALARSIDAKEPRIETLGRIARRVARLGSKSIDATLTADALYVAADVPAHTPWPAPGVLERTVLAHFGVPLVMQHDDHVGLCAPAGDVPAASAGATLALAWLERLRSMEAECVRGVDPEGPHQIRVAVRRLRTTLRLLDRVPGVTGLDPVVVRVRALGDLAGSVRDNDVVIQRVRKLDVDGDAIDAATKHLERRRTRAFQRARRVLLSANTAAAIEHVRTAIAMAGAVEADVRLDHAARSLLDRTFRQLRRQSREGVVDGEAYHALRRRIRRIRDVIDVFGPVLKSGDVAWRKRLQPVQSHLGSLNDIETALQIVPKTLTRALPVRRALARQRLDTLTELAVPLMLTLSMVRER